MKISNKYLTPIKVMVLHEELGLATKIGKKFTHWDTPIYPSPRLISTLKAIYPRIENSSFNQRLKIYNDDGEVIISW